ncbi:MAG TPA: hypothetical protein IAB39_08090 [Candidatus Onthovicinus excrementipullorum]|nr:hypothetical protein [Candidatus Onthovicinus excrementipullorum]
MNDKINELLELIRTNPDLPIVPMVDSEIVGSDEYARWMAAWGYSYIGEYFLGEERVHYRNDKDSEEIQETLIDGQISYDDFDAMSEKIRKGIIKQLETGAILLPPGVEVVKDAGWATIRTAKEQIKGGEKNE